MPDPVAFFDNQFRRQVAEHDFALNPFELIALEHVAGDVLDFGCGLGNLTLAAARRGCRVLALDASECAIERIRSAVRESEGALAVDARRTDLAGYAIPRDFDTIVSIGVLMFFRREVALAHLAQIQAHVAPGGVAVVNVLIEGTTFMGMFKPGESCLFGRDELAERFDDWRVLVSRCDGFDAPGGTRKEFATVVARKPARVPG